MNHWDEFCKLNKTQLDYLNVSLDPNKFMPERRSEIGKKWISSPKNSLILHGKTGRGKTYFLHCLMKGIIQRFGISSSRFFKSKVLDDRLLLSSKEHGNANFLLEQLKEIPFLFVDDFGIERDGQRAEREYYDFIDDRVANRKPIIISTNLTDEDILKNYGDRIHSRLKTCIGIEFSGEDLRGDLMN